MMRIEIVRMIMLIRLMASSLLMNKKRKKLMRTADSTKNDSCAMRGDHEIDAMGWEAFTSERWLWAEKHSNMRLRSK